MTNIATNYEKDQEDANAPNAEHLPPDSDLAPTGQKEHKKYKKKKRKHEGNKEQGPVEDIFLTARPEQSMPVTHPGSATSAILNGAALPPEVEPTSGPVPTEPFSDSAADEAQGQDIQEPTAVAHEETIERKPSKCDASPAIPVSVAPPCDKFSSRHDQDEMDIGMDIVLLVTALITFIVWLIFLSQEKQPSEKHATNGTKSTHE
ncbi:uncharacterized protein LOC135399551 [Ornithodoros turicata]|uniref:uncharacterized protein LOC135399551 n=1 Tax=Ornithodoros turicata TaxID=34597 RepID=UPI00313A04CD